MLESSPFAFLCLTADGSAADSHSHLCSTARPAAPTHPSGSAGTQHWSTSFTATGPVQLLSSALQVTVLQVYSFLLQNHYLVTVKHLCCFCHLILRLHSLRSQQAFLQSSLSQQSMMLSGPSLHSYPGMQAPELGKPQSSLAYQQPSSTQHIPILFEPQLNQPSGMGGSQLIDTHLLQVMGLRAADTLYYIQIFSNIWSFCHFIFPVIHLACVLCPGSTGDESTFKHVLGAGTTTWSEQLL